MSDTTLSDKIHVFFEFDDEREMEAFERRLETALGDEKFDCSTYSFVYDLLNGAILYFDKSLLPFLEELAKPGRVWEDKLTFSPVIDD